MKIFSIINQKGGVGKTTTAINLSACLAKIGKKVLLVDFDPQGNASMGCGIDKGASNTVKISDLLCGPMYSVDKAIAPTDFGFDIIVSNHELTATEVKLRELSNGVYNLKAVLEDVRQAYDYEYVIVDCPPSLNFLTINALTASNFLIIPVQCEYYALEGISDLLDTVTDIKASLNPNLQISGYLRTMLDSRNLLARDVSNQLLLYFPGKVYRTIIPRNVKLAESPSYGKPIIYYDLNCAGSVNFNSFAREVASA